LADKVYTFNYTGAVQTLTVPTNIKRINLEVYGAKGAFSYSGNGGKSVGEYVLDPAKGRILYIYVGGTTGWNGGGTAYNGSYGNACGGGASDVRLVPATTGSWYDTAHTSWPTDASLLSRIIVAGGGGGIASTSYGYAGAGGGLSGSNAAQGGSTGATQTSGGLGNTMGSATRSPSGGFGYGGSMSGGAGGGGGWYGGGSSNMYTYGGGGGSGYVALLNNGVTTANVNNTNGKIIITLISEDKYLLRKGGKYYSISSAYYDASIHDFTPLTLNGGDYPNDSDFQNFGFKYITDLTTSITVGGDTLLPITKFLGSDVEVIYGRFK
jgi:hypothetical protein